MMTNGNRDARGYVSARDGQDAYRKLLVDLGLRDRDPFETLREDPFETDLDVFYRESRGVGSNAPWDMRGL